MPRSVFLCLLLLTAAAAQTSAAPSERIAELCDQLLTGSEARRISAAYALWAMGKEARPAVASLTRALHDESREVRFAATEALEAVGSATAARALAKVLPCWEAEVRLHAVEALADLGPHALPRIPRLIRMLDDGNERVRNAAHDTLVDLSESNLRLEGLLQGASRQGLRPQALIAAAWLLVELELDATPLLPGLLSLQTGDDVEVSDLRSALDLEDLLQEIGVGDGSAYLDALHTGFDDERDAVLAILLDMGPRALPAAPSVIRVLDDPRRGCEDRGGVDFAVQVLWQMGPKVLPLLLEELDSSSRARRLGVCHAFREFADAPAESVSSVEAQAPTRLLRVLRADACAEVRAEAALALGALHAQPRLVVPALCAALSGEPAPVVRGRMTWALGSFQEHPQAIEGLRRALEDHDSGVRNEAMETLGQCGLDALPAVPELVRLALYEEEYWVRGRARSILCKLGEDVERNAVATPWALPSAFAWELLALFLLLAGWFGLEVLFPRQRPASKPKRLAHVLIVALVPAVAACGAIVYAVTREWTAPFQPDPLFTVVPFPVSAALSVAFCCALAAVWATRCRPPRQGDEEPSLASGRGVGLE